MSHCTRRHLSMSINPVRRHEGDSFARQVAYIGRTTQLNPRTNISYDFTGTDDVEASGIVGWEGDMDSLVEAVVSSEPRNRSKVVEGRIAKLALPAEFDAAMRLKAVKSCARYFAETFQVAVVAAIHRPPQGGDERNWHSHILLSSRVVEGASLGAKTRILDTLKTGPALIEAFRAWWCAELNAMLREAGHLANIEHKSFARLGVQAEPSYHMGERRTAIARRQELKECWTLPPLSQPAITCGSELGHDLVPVLVGAEISAVGAAPLAGPSYLIHLQARPPLPTPQVKTQGLEWGG